MTPARYDEVPTPADRGGRWMVQMFDGTGRQVYARCVVHLISETELNGHLSVRPGCTTIATRLDENRRLL